MSVPKGPQEQGVDRRPPRRLIDTDARANGEAWGVDLLRDAEPARASSFRKQRIRLALGQHTTRRAPLALRPVIIVGVLGCAAAASAALGHWPSWIQNTYRKMTTASHTDTMAVKAARPTNQRRAEAVPSEAPEVAEAPEAPAVEAPVVPVLSDEAAKLAAMTANETASASASSRLSRTRHADVRTHQGPRGPGRKDHAEGLQVAVVRAPAPVAGAARIDVPPARERALAPSRPTPVSAVRNAEDTSVVSQAMRALRVDRDPVRARVLAKQYLDQYPNGALAEEALAISVEAATAHHDTDAAALGARYLRLYPAGSFRARALRAVASL